MEEIALAIATSSCITSFAIRSLCFRLFLCDIGVTPSFDYCNYIIARYNVLIKGKRAKASASLSEGGFALGRRIAD